jgi:hypothetical protein
MPRIMLFPNSLFSELQPTFQAVPFIIRISEPIRLGATRTFYDLLVAEDVRNSGFAVYDFRETYGHFLMCAPLNVSNFK